MLPPGEITSIFGGRMLTSGTGGGGFIISISLSSAIGISPVLNSGVTISLVVVVDTVVTFSLFSKSLIDIGFGVLNGFSVCDPNGWMISGLKVGRSIGKDVTFGLVAITSRTNGFGVVVAMKTGIGCLVFTPNAWL
jgi:hypothetical protein